MAKGEPAPGGAKPFLRNVIILIIIGIVVYFWGQVAEAGWHYEWQWNRVWRHFYTFGPDGFKAGPLLKGLGLTIGITALGLVFSSLLGLVAAIFRLSPWPVCSALAKIYIQLWRNTPLLLQLFFAYFLISPLLDLGPFGTAVLALSAFEGAYMAEVFRGGLLSVPKGQWEAALSLGLSVPQTFKDVILPQAAANICPALVNQGIAILKDSSLVSAIAVADLTMRSQAIVAETFLAFEVWLLAGGLYLLLALCMAIPAMWLEHIRPWR